MSVSGERRFQWQLLGCGQAAKQNSRVARTGIMRFLLRVAFWLGLILVLLPTGGSNPHGSGPRFGAADAVTFAGAAVADMRQFCGRQPDACAAGGQAAQLIGQRAQAGAKMLYEFLNEHVTPVEMGSVPTTGTAEKSMPVQAPHSQHTLKPADLAPAWGGPAPRREAEAKRPA
jgi:hypothetical protein